MIQLETPYDEGPSTNDQVYDQQSQSSSEKIPDMVSTSKHLKRHNTLIETPSPTTNKKYYNSKPIITKARRHDTSSSNRSGIPTIIMKSSEDTSFSKMKDLESSDRWREDNSSNLFCCWYDYIDELIYDTFSTCTPIACVDGCGALIPIWTEE